MALAQVRKRALETGINELLGLLASTSEDNLLRIMRLAQSLAPTKRERGQIAWLRERFEEGHPSTKLALRVLRETAPNVRRKVVNALFVGNLFLAPRVREAYAAEHGHRPPFLIVVSPLMRCNLRCYGCYAWEYTKRDELEPELFDRVLSEAHDMGVYLVTVSGGEPLLYEPLFDVVERHPDMVFQFYTNGTLIDETVARRIVEVGNLVPAISVEGLQAETDGRRGPGTFEKICEAMRLLREAGALYGFSATATSLNTDVLTRPEFIDFWMEQGCYFGWFFTYIPIGREPDTSLMQTPEQRDRLRRWTLEIRRTRPIFVADFWNDGHLTCGCMAGGTKYLHINHRGDVEPCVFAHFAVDNIREKSLAEALESAFFADVRSRIPYDGNVLRPCMIIDHPEVLREVVVKHGARSTDGGGDSLLNGLAPHLDRYAQEWKQIADQAWNEGYEWAKEGGILAR